MRRMLAQIRRGPFVTVILLLIAVLLLGADSFGQLTSRAAGVPDSAITPAVGASRTLVVAIQDVPAHTTITDGATFAGYFEDVAVPSGAAVPPGAVPSIEAIESIVLSGTSFLAGIDVRNAIRKRGVLRAGDLRLFPLSPIASLSRQIRPGRVAVALPVAQISADNQAILPGDLVDVLVTLPQRALSSLTSNPPNGYNVGPLETQQIITDVRVLITVPFTNIYTLELPLQDALLLKYMRDSQEGTIDLALRSAQDVRNAVPQAATNPIVPEYFLTPMPLVINGTPLPSPAPGGVANPFIPLKPTPTPIVPTPAPATPPIALAPQSPFRQPTTPQPTIVLPIINP